MAWYSSLYLPSLILLLQLSLEPIAFKLSFLPHKETAHFKVTDKFSVLSYLTHLQYLTQLLAPFSFQYFLYLAARIPRSLVILLSSLIVCLCVLIHKCWMAPSLVLGLLLFYIYTPSEISSYFMVLNYLYTDVHSP